MNTDGGGAALRIATAQLAKLLGQISRIRDAAIGSVVSSVTGIHDAACSMVY